MSEKNDMKNVNENELNPIDGTIALLSSIGLIVIAIVVFVLGCVKRDINVTVGVSLMMLSLVSLLLSVFLFMGLHIIHPNEALVMTCFGKYYGTIKKAGFFFVNPFAVGYNPSCSEKADMLEDIPQQSGTKPKKKISMKTLTLKNEKQKVNDVLGNPIIIGSVVIWRVVEPTKAVMNVENYHEFLSIQCDAVIRNIARMYPYDDMGEQEEHTNEKTLRGSSQEIADTMKKELQERVAEAGLEIKEVKITNIAYSDEIAAAMLQRQQATAVIAARQKIVEGAVSMVKMAIDQLGEEEIVILDEERKAAMVSNLLVVLCGNKDAQPVVNSSSIY